MVHIAKEKKKKEFKMVHIAKEKKKKEFKMVHIAKEKIIVWSRTLRMSARDVENLGKQSNAHYERMIAWAVQQEPYKEVSPGSMQYALQEKWTGSYCPLCIKAGACHRCFLSCAGVDCAATPWYKMNASRIWRTWVKHAVEEQNLLNRLFAEALAILKEPEEKE
jgi:hypothetical protein